MLGVLRENLATKIAGKIGKLSWPKSSSPTLDSFGKAAAAATGVGVTGKAGTAIGDAIGKKYVKPKSEK